MPSPYYGSNYIGLNSGATVFIGADSIMDPGGYTYYTQYFKLVYGVTGTATPVTSGNPLPVSVAGGMTATISGFSGTITVQGTPSGTAVPVSGNLLVSGLTGAPVYVRTASGVQVEVTGGRYINKSTDSISIYGPAGSSFVSINIAGTSGNYATVSNGALNVNLIGATISATIPSTVTVVGLSGATAVNVTVGNTVGINDTNILNGMTVTYSQLNAMGVTLNAIYNALSVFGLVRPTTAKSTVLYATTLPAVLGSGFTCASGVNLKSLGSNTDLIYLGGASVGSSYGYQLEPGEQVFFNVVNLNMIYAMSKSGTQTLSYFAS
jgi:hypothetical protein